MLPDGRILTESLAMVHYLADLAPEAGLIPARSDPARASLHIAQKASATAGVADVMKGNFG